MAVLALGLVGAGIGAAVGGTILGMSAVSIGWTIGSTLGGMLFQPDGEHTHGSRLQDLKIQSSARGSPIPHVYGTSRIAGNVIWSGGIKETSHVQETGGKGGPESGSHTSYTYSCSFAVGLCEGEITGIGKIWADSVLIYSKDENATADELAVSSTVGVTVHTGSEAQLPDTTIEAKQGVNDTPAFRGLAYVVFEDLQLEKYGNRIPNVTCEIVSKGTELVGWDVFINQDIGFTYVKRTDACCIRTDLSTHNSIIVENTGENSQSYLRRTFDSGGNVIATDQLGGNFPYYYNPFYFSFGPLIANGESVRLWNPITSTVSVEINGINCIPTVKADFGPTLFLCGLASTVDTTKLFLLVNSTAFTNHGTHWYLLSKSGAVITIEDQGTASGDSNSYMSVGNPDQWLTGGAVLTNDCKTVWCTSGGDYTYWHDMDDNNHIAFSSSNSIYHAWSASGGNRTSSITLIDDVVYVFQGSGFARLTRQETISLGVVLLSDIITDLCAQCNVPATSIDVSDLTTTEVKGYTRTNSMTSRLAIAPLLQAYQVTAVESDNKLKFYRATGNYNKVVYDNELAAYESGELPDRLLISRDQEIELPRRVSISYSDFNGDYQVGEQHAQRVK